MFALYVFVHIWNEELIYQKSIESEKEHCRQLRAECDIEREMVFTGKILTPPGDDSHVDDNIMLVIL